MQRILTVTTASTTADLTLLATVKDRLGITVSTYDTRLAQIIKRVSDAIANACNRVFAEETVKETLFIDKSIEAIILARAPATSITSVVVDGTTVDTDEYTVEEETGKLLRLDTSGNLTTWSPGKTEITYVGGYELLATLPYDIEEACLVMVSHAWSAGSRDPMAKRIEIPDVQTVDYWVGSVSDPGQFPSAVETLIAPYRRYSV